LWTKEFWLDVAERAVKTFAQAVVAVLIASTVTSAFAVAWLPVIGTGLLAALISVLTSVASAGKSADGGVKTASLVDDVTYDRPVHEV
jgi:hypothetical protein